MTLFGRPSSHIQCLGITWQNKIRLMALSEVAMQHGEMTIFEEEISLLES